MTVWCADAKTRFVAAAVCTSLTLGGCGGSVATGSPTTSPVQSVDEYAPAIVVDQFTNVIDNPLFPLAPGSQWEYSVTTAEGSVDGLLVEVAAGDKIIMGVETTSVTVTLSVDGEIEEQTVSWFAQHDTGDVWLFGEIDTGFEGGELVETTTWEAGLDGAQPGVAIPAQGDSGDVFRVGHVPGVVEEWGRVVAENQSIDVSAGFFAPVTVIENWSEIDPIVVERKHYAEGVGLVFIDSESTEADTVELLSFTIVDS